MNRNIRHNQNNAAESEASPLPARLLVERLRLEAVLRQQEYKIIPVQNLIVVPFPGFKTGVIVQEGEGCKLAVHIRTPLGSVLMVDQARELLASRQDANGSQKVELLGDADLWVTWTREFENGVDTSAVMEAFGEQVRVAFNTQRVVAEECYFSAESVELIKQEGGRY